MSGLLTALYTGASGIYTSQHGVQVTGNNISNVNTEGYSRQIANVEQAESLAVGKLIVGTGSSVVSVSRTDSLFLTRQLTAQAASFGRYDAAATPLNNLEQIFTIDDSGLSGDIDAFFAAWSELSNNPSGTAEREQVLQAAETLADHFGQLDQQLTEASESIDTMLEGIVPTLNSQLEEIADLNGRILSAQAGGSDANSLLDRRDLLVQEVCETSGATIYYNESEMVCLQLPNGLPLVEGNTASSLTTSRVDGHIQISLTTGSREIAIDGNDVDGSLAGLFEVRDELIPQLESELDELAYTLASDVNGLHSSGLDGNGAAGQDLFTIATSADPTDPVYTGAAAGLSLALSDATEVVAGTSGESGDNSLALEIAALGDGDAINSATYSEDYARIAAKVGLLVSNNEEQLASSTELLAGTLDAKEALCGVSADEEMLLLIQYQAGYEAAANYLSVVKDMFDTLLNM